MQDADSFHTALTQASKAHSGQGGVSAPLAGGSDADLAESIAIFTALEISLEGREP
jgi:hypothetical protein